MNNRRFIGRSLEVLGVQWEDELLTFIDSQYNLEEFYNIYKEEEEIT